MKRTNWQSILRSTLNWICSVLCILSGIVGQAQGAVPNVIPPSPEVAGLLKSIDTPMNYFSGIPSISIPLFEARSGDISVPVSISYHSGGIRVDEISSRIGLGWNLNAGGIVTRTVRGVNDDSPLGFWHNTHTIEEFESYLGEPYTLERANAIRSLAQQVVARELDYEPDLFSFSYPGYSGQFIIDADGTVITIPASEHKIEFFENSGGISSLKITNELGFQYFYGAYGAQDARDSTGFTFAYSDATTPSGGISAPNSVERFANAWHLLAIHSPNSDSKVEFFYESRVVQSLLRSGQTWANNALNDCPSLVEGIATNYLINETYEQVLIAIDSELGTVSFTYDNDNRLDLPGDKRLMRVSMNTTGTYYDFNHSYWISPDFETTQLPFPMANDKKQLTHRLKLNGLDKKAMGESAIQKYGFEYDESHALPNRFSFAQDMWGFYNGKHTNNQLISNYFGMTVGATPTNQFITYIPGADRRVDHVYSNAHNIKSITHPTGGKTEFSFESNGAVRLNTDKLFAQTFFDLDDALLVNYVYQEGAPLYFEQTFTVDNSHVDQVLHFSYDVAGCGSSTNSGGILNCGIQVALVGVGHSYSRALSLINDAYFRVDPGTYKITISVVDDNGITGNVTSAFAKLKAFINPSPNVAFGEYLVGGRRIKSIKSIDENQTQLEKLYTYIMDENLSTGRLADQTFVMFDPNVNCGENLAYTSYLYSSESMIPLLGTGTGHIGYVEVTEKQIGTSGVGYTKFMYDWEYDVEYGTTFPYPPYGSQSWKRGNQIEVNVVSGDNQSTIKNSVTTYNYASILGDPTYNEVKAYKIGQHGSTYHWSFYNVLSGANHIESQVETYFDGISELETSTHYNYDYNYFRPSKTSVLNSRGESILTEVFYPDNGHLISYLNSQEKELLEDMVDQNIVAVPILSQTRTVGEFNFQSKALNKYINFNGKFLLSSLYKWNRNDETFYEDTKITYNPQFKLSQLETMGSVKSFLWSYEDKLPVAVLDNISITEVNSSLGSNLVTLRSSYDDNEILGFVDNLRQAFPNAIVTGYTHKIGVGVKKVVDGNNELIEYQYDPFGRLQYVRDSDGNLINEYKYIYRVN